MSPGEEGPDLGIRYHPDEWAHDLDQWWEPLASLAAATDCRSGDWLAVLGVEEFFDDRLLGQTRILTPWVCLAATAVAASAVRGWVEAAERPGRDAGVAWSLAATAFGLAVSLQELRWSGQKVGEGVVTTAELIGLGRAALAAQAELDSGPAEPTGLCLAAGWLAHSRAGDQRPGLGAGGPARAGEPAPTAEQAIAEIARTSGWSDPLALGTAHLIERLLAQELDRLPARSRPDDPPDEAQANVLLAAGHGQVGLFEARRQRSLLPLAAGAVVPDLARMAFLHGSPDFLDSVAVAFAAADQADRFDRPDELISWSLQLSGGDHPLAERAVSGRSAGLGAYVAFRSLSHLGVFADRDVAFTGQVLPDGSVDEVRSASAKIGAAHSHRIRLIVYPKGQAWRDPHGSVGLTKVETAEDALIAASPQLRGLRSYLEAACRLVTPEPWLRTWLQKQGQSGDEMPLLTVMCRQLPLSHDPSAEPGTRLAAAAGGKEPEISPGPAHLLASSYPGYSFAISADAGGGSTTAAKRMAAEAARQSLDRLRALGGDERTAGYTLPLYLPLGELPTSWDSLIQASVTALPMLAAPALEVGAALAGVLAGSGARTWRALLVVDGTDRSRRGGNVTDRERDFVALITGRPYPGQPGWRPSVPPQVVLCGRNGSPAHRRAGESLLRERPGGAAAMALDPLSGPEIDRYVASFSLTPRALNGKERDLATNPLLLALSVIAGRPHIGDGDSTDLMDRVIDVLLGTGVGYRRFLAEIAFRAAVAKREPVGEFTLTDIAIPESAAAVRLALAADDNDRARAMALDQDERRSLQSAEEETHLLTSSGSGWRFFHDRIFAFLVADRIARHGAEDDGPDDELFGELRPHLDDPLWADVVEATGRLLELRDQQVTREPRAGARS